MGRDAPRSGSLAAPGCLAMSTAARPQAIPAPEAIIFDLYGTLLDISALAGHVRAEVAPVDADAFVALWRRKQLEYSWLHTLMDRYVDFWQVTQAALRHTARNFDVSLHPTVEPRLMEGWLRLPPFDEVATALTDLARRPLAILSNGSSWMLEAGLPADIRARFREVLSVDLVAAYKPTPRVYRLATERLGLPPDRILFVSANQWDVAGAAAFGLRVAWLDRTGAARDELPGKPHVVASDLVELSRALDMTTA